MSIVRRQIYIWALIIQKALCLGNAWTCNTSINAHGLSKPRCTVRGEGGFDSIHMRLFFVMKI